VVNAGFQQPVTLLKLMEYRWHKIKAEALSEHLDLIGSVPPFLGLRTGSSTTWADARGSCSLVAKAT